MSSLSFIAFLTFFATAQVVSRKQDKIYLNKKTEEWNLLAEFFNLKPSSPIFTRFSLNKGLKLTAFGIFQNYHIDCVWSQTERDGTRIVCKIEITNPRKLIFDLNKGKSFFKKGNITLDDPYFQQNFNLNSNDVDEISLLFDDTIISNIRKIFSRNLDATLCIEKKEVKPVGKDLLLDETDTYFLVYTNFRYPFQTKADRLFIQDNLLLMLDIARKIDSLKMG